MDVMNEADHSLRRAIGAPVLNFDIMWLIMSFLPKEHAYSVMKTCKMLYSLGIPLLFRPQVHISGKEKMKSFRDFMLGDPQRSPNLFRHLRVLEISSIHRLNTSEVLMLTEILSHSNRIEELVLPSELSPRRVARYNEFTGALTRLSQLRSLKVSDAEGGTLSWVKELNAPLSELDLYFSTVDLPEPLPALLHFSSTLTKLRLDFVSFMTKPTSSFCFPHVHTLEVVFFEIHPAATIFRIFPNVKNLDVLMHLVGMHDPPTHDEIHREHIENKRTLGHYFHDLPSLDHLSGEPTDLYRSALICPAKEWHVTGYDGYSAEWLLPMLRHIHLGLLNLCIDFGFLREEFAIMYLLEPIFREAAIPTTLKRLELHVVFVNALAEEIIKKLPKFIGKIPTKALNLELEREPALEDVVVQELASRIASKSPALRNLLISPSSRDAFIGMYLGRFSLTAFIKT